MVEFYGGRTPLYNATGYGSDFRVEDPRQSGVGVGRGMFNGVPQQQRVFNKRNFSALNQPSSFYAPNLENSTLTSGVIPNKNISFAPSNRQQINKANNRFSALNTNAKSSPNQKNNLLDFIVSPQGKGIAQGLLEASGYSDTPVSFGQALAQGMARGNEAQARADEQAYKKQLFDFQKQQFEYSQGQDAIKNELELQKILNKDNRIDLQKKMAVLHPNLVEGTSAYTNKAMELIKSGAVNVDQKLDFKTKSEFLESDIKRVDKMFETLIANKDVNAVYDRMLAIAENPDFKSGKMSEMTMPLKRLLVSSGLMTEKQVEDFNLQQLFETEQSFVTPRMRPPGSGASSDFEQKLYANASATLGKETDVNRLILYARSTYGKMNEELTRFYDEYLRENSELPLNKVNDAFKTYLDENRDVMAQVVGTENIMDNDDAFIKAVKDGTIAIGDVYFNNDKEDKSYNSHQLLNTETYNKIMEMK